MSAPAKSAATALSNLREGLDRNKKELSSMNAAMRDMRKAGDNSSEGFKLLEKQIADKSKTVGEMRSKYVELGGTFRQIKPEKVAKELTLLQKVAEGVPGPIGKLAGSMQGMGKFLAAGLVVAGIVAIGVALVSLAASALAAGAALVSYGIRTADARRSEGLRLEGLTRMRRGMHATGESASAMQAAIDRVSDSSSASRSTLEGYAARLHRLGLRGDNFTAALEGMATRGEVLGDRYAQSFAGMAAATARAGGSVRRLADDVQARLGDIAGKKLIALDVTTRKLRENLESLFRNVRIEGFLKLFREVASTFSQARVTGRALAGIMERMFAPLDRGAENSVGSVRRFFTVLVTNVIRLENTFLRLQVASLETWRALNEHGITFEGTMNKLRAGASLWGAAFMLPFTMASAAAGAFADSIRYVQGVGAAAGERMRKIWHGLDMRSIASNLIDGLVMGIITGTVRVVAAVTTMAEATTGALRDALQIKSPSRVFANLGREIPRGLAVGVRAGEDTARASIANMIDASTGDLSVTPRGTRCAGGHRTMTPDDPGGAAAPSSRTAISIGDVYITSAATDSAGIAQDIRAALAEALEGVAFMRGAAA